jgi:hypothetical protein
VSSAASLQPLPGVSIVEVLFPHVGAAHPRSDPRSRVLELHACGHIGGEEEEATTRRGWRQSQVGVARVTENENGGGLPRPALKGIERRCRPLSPRAFFFFLAEELVQHSSPPFASFPARTPESRLPRRFRRRTPPRPPLSGEHRLQGFSVQLRLPLTFPSPLRCCRCFHRRSDRRSRPHRWNAAAAASSAHLTVDSHLQ